MENTRLQGGIDIDVMLPASTLHQYSNMYYNNEYHYPFMNGKIPTSKNSSILTSYSPSVNSTNEEVCSLQIPINDEIKYSELSKIQ